uniref:FBD domain-containing protein n=1 Tax=Heterorhabditis bacteriophora TaxID=37862 RepID=A0A1I7WAK0_HETBA
MPSLALSCKNILRCEEFTPLQLAVFGEMPSRLSLDTDPESDGTCFILSRINSSSIQGVDQIGNPTLNLNLLQWERGKSPLTFGLYTDDDQTTHRIFIKCYLNMLHNRASCLGDFQQLQSRAHYEIYSAKPRSKLLIHFQRRRSFLKSLRSCKIDIEYFSFITNARYLV